MPTACQKPHVMQVYLVACSTRPSYLFAVARVYIDYELSLSYCPVRGEFFAAIVALGYMHMYTTSTFASRRLCPWRRDHYFVMPK
ncbi:hypothetical protein BD310DRAFT_434238 [Dichomitus squalens]|uniref:Uncharacterized protein n=1 Tax=Dichomitus squalens TaxID=114155 RepID=A0A4Q9PWW5_9APHY|nr:hypothetical protein BD310DRAFT_434238 [Dichomitus squalens]